MNRHDLTLRSKTLMAQRLQIANVHEFVQRQPESEEFDDQIIINKDKTQVYFNLVPNGNINVKGRKSIWVRTTASDKSQLTVMLTQDHL